MHTGAGKVKALLGKPGAMDQHSILEELQLLVTSLQTLIVPIVETRPTLKKRRL